jgi:hypothetical protein
MPHPVIEGWWFVGDIDWLKYILAARRRLLVLTGVRIFRAASASGWDDLLMVGVRIRMILSAALAVVLLFYGAHGSYQYLAGTPTTATVTSCAATSLHGDQKMHNCKATWNIGGQSQTGPLSTGARVFGSDQGWMFV